MSRIRIVLPVVAAAFGMFLTVSTASAHPPHPPMPHPLPGPHPHPGPHPIVVHPPVIAPAFKSPVWFKPPIVRPYPVVLSPTIVVTDPVAPVAFRVMYRPSDADAWAIYNDYAFQTTANDVAVDLQRQHFQTQILTL